MRVATDIGGTFTDLVYIDDHNEVRVEKSSTTPPNFEEGILDVIQKSGINTAEIEDFIHGSTVVINALTERKGAKTALITTKGFRDVLEIARGNRPDLFNIRYKKPEPFVERYLRKEVEERLDADGQIVTKLNIAELEQIIEELKAENVEAIAVVYLHSYLNPIHEIETRKIIQALWPEVFVTVSHEITREWREYERTSSTVLNSYVKPVASTYLNKLSRELAKMSNSRNYVMQSNGGTTTFEHAKELPIHMLESGPVAGVYGSAILGNIIGESNIIAFDIGGTTAKCSLIENGEMKVSTDYYIEKSSFQAGYPVRIPVVDIVEIGNGGGSIAWIDEVGSLKVGPQSAGSRPGPIAYGQGGTEPTTTDANLLTGRLSPENFDYSVNLSKIEEAIKEKIGNPFSMTAVEAALGIIRIANANMLNALKLISIRKGHDPRQFTMVAFGGGGSMHAAALAKEIGIKKVVIPFASAVFSAWGMLMTDLRQDQVITYNRAFSNIDFMELDAQWTMIENDLQQRYVEDGVIENIVFSRFVDVRYVGQEHTVKVPVPSGEWDAEIVDEIIEQFHMLHEKNYTFRLQDTACEIVSLHVTAFGQVRKPELSKHWQNGAINEALKEVRPVYYDQEGWVDTPVYARHLLPTNQIITGPAIVEEKASVTIIEKGQSIFADEYRNLIINTGVEAHE